MLAVPVSLLDTDSTSDCTTYSAVATLKTPRHPPPGKEKSLNSNLPPSPRLSSQFEIFIIASSCFRATGRELIFLLVDDFSDERQELGKITM